MCDRSEVSPEPFPSRCPKHHVPALRRHIEPGVVGIVEGKAMHRHQSARLERPLIWLGHVAVVADEPGVTRREAASDLLGLSSVDRLDERRGVGEDHRLVPPCAKPIHGPVAEHANTDALNRDFCRALLRGGLGSRACQLGPRRNVIINHTRRPSSLERRHGCRREIQRRGSCKAFLIGKPRHAGVHHHHAREEPRDEQHAANDAKPSVGIDQPSPPIEPVHDALSSSGCAQSPSH